MKNSSAAQLELDYSGSNTAAPGSLTVNVAQEPEDAQTSSSLRVPNFALYGEMYAVTARIASRINASVVSDAEHQALLKERQKLLDRKFAETMTREESNRLEYVRWSLDRIEDAKHGHTLDEIENYVNKYEQFLHDVRNLDEQLRQRLPRGK